MAGPQPKDEKLEPYTRRYELSVEDGCVLWESRVVVPPKGKTKVLQMLKLNNFGLIVPNCSIIYRSWYINSQMGIQ